MYLKEFEYNNVETHDVWEYMQKVTTFINVYFMLFLQCNHEHIN